MFASKTSTRVSGPLYGSIALMREPLRNGVRSMAFLCNMLLRVSLFSGSVAAEKLPPVDSVFRFERYYIELGTAQRQTVLTGFFTGKALADLLVFHRNERGEGAMQVFSFVATGWMLREETALAPDVLFVDRLGTGFGDRLITYRPGQLQWFVPGAAEAEGQLMLQSSFVPPRRNEIPHVDVTRDLNGDGRDDIVLPDGDGFWIVTQGLNGGMSRPVKIGGKTDLSGILGADGYRYRPWSHSRIQRTDFNHDGLPDLVYWKMGSFFVHTQSSNGLFAPESVRYPDQGFFQSDDRYSLARGEMTGTVLRSMVDFNGDEITDLVIGSMTGRSLSEKRSSYSIHFGTRGAKDETLFATSPSLTLQSNDRLQVALSQQDLNSDDRVEFLVTSIEKDALTSSLWKRLKGMMGDDIRLTVEFYRGGEGLGTIQPSSTCRIDLDGVPSHRERGSVPLDLVLRGATHERRQTQTIWPRAFNSTFLVGDVTGDGNSDLLISSHPRQLTFVAGVAGPGLFSEYAQSIPIALPNDEEYSWLADLNRDGKQDLIMHRPYTERDAHGARINPPGTDSQQLSILLAR